MRRSHFKKEQETTQWLRFQRATCCNHVNPEVARAASEALHFKKEQETTRWLRYQRATSILGLLPSTASERSSQSVYLPRSGLSAILPSFTARRCARLVSRRTPNSRVSTAAPLLAALRSR